MEKESSRRETRKITVLRFGQGVHIAVVVLPGYDRDEIGHKRRDAAFQNGRIPPDDVLVVHLALVELLHDYKRHLTTVSRLVSAIFACDRVRS